jgi:hypothetical protein
VAWASGAHGTVLRTEDGGYMWQSCSRPPGAEKLDFRAIWAWDQNTAIVLSSGPGDLSRLYRTTDGCSHWKLLATNPDPSGFWDAISFWSPQEGALLGDPVDGRFVMLLTEDGGKHWRRDGSADLNLGGRKLGAFAASNSALLQVYDHVGTPTSFATGGVDGPVVFLSWASCTAALSQRNPDACNAPEFSHYAQARVPIAGGADSAGIFSWAVHAGPNSPIYVAVGGDYTKPGDATATAAWSGNGQSWTLAAHPPRGYRSTVAWDPAPSAWIAAGPNGSDISYDEGKTWRPLDASPQGGRWNALSLPWIVGENGRIGRLDEAKLPH